MARDIPEPTFIEFGQVAQAPVRVTEDLGWQRVVEFLRSRELSASTLKAYGCDSFRVKVCNAD
ncbi:hypothetical protein Lepto7375DRAFT_0815 [Leptolyngbya sp. PCC 7375]|nr:hypothetical protein Lepto7375DRAFT_0815 [Leptolyngbya sp. PCC 7375]